MVKGNFPESCSLEATSATDLPEEKLTDLSVAWENVLPRTKLQHTRATFFENEILDAGPGFAFALQHLFRMAASVVACLCTLA